MGPTYDAKAFYKAAGNTECAAYFKDLLLSWNATIESTLSDAVFFYNSGNSKRCIETRTSSNNNSGGGTPAATVSELSRWKSTAAQLNHLVGQITNPESKAVIGIAGAASPSSLSKWKHTSSHLLEAANQAQDTILYLKSFQKSVDKLARCNLTTPDDVHVVCNVTLPGVLRAAEVVHSVSSYYHSKAALSTLLRSVSCTLMDKCTQYILLHNGTTNTTTATFGGEERKSLWEQPYGILLLKLDNVTRMYREFTGPALQLLLDSSTNTKKEYDRDPCHIHFSQFTLFKGRCEKLHTFFSIVRQFSTLSQKNGSGDGSGVIPGMDGIASTFQSLLAEVKAKRLDLLDVNNKAFDKELLEFQVRVNDLELDLERHLRGIFDTAPSVQQALAWLQQFDGLLDRRSFLAEMDSMYSAAFQRYTAYLDGMQQKYESHKDSPPVPLGQPLMAGSVMWARSLLNHIEQPMSVFCSHGKVFQTKESTITVQTYNRLARALIEFEGLWYQAWVHGVGSIADQVHHTLLATIDNKGCSDGGSSLVVNLDKGVLQLMQEAECFIALGFEIPEKAATLLTQRHRLTHHFNQLLKFARDLHSVTTVDVPPVLSPILQPQVDRFIATEVRPGLETLVWTSVNVDGFIHSVQCGLKKMLVLKERMIDYYWHRVVANAKDIERISLLSVIDRDDLQLDSTSTSDAAVEQQSKHRAVSCQQFEKQQLEHLKHQVGIVEAKSKQIQQAYQDIETLLTSSSAVDEKMCPLKRHCGDLITKAIAVSISSSLSSFKTCLSFSHDAATNTTSRSLFFAIDLQLQVPTIVTYPPLSSIQAAVNKVVEELPVMLDGTLSTWWVANDNLNKHSVLSCLKRLVVKQDVGTTSLLSLVLNTEATPTTTKTNSGNSLFDIGTLQQHVDQYCFSFNSFSALWKSNAQQEYDLFISTNPGPLEHKAKLQQLLDMEHSLSSLAVDTTIGPLKLHANGLRSSLLHEASPWKIIFGKKLKEGAQKQLTRLESRVAELADSLPVQVVGIDIEDVAPTMTVIQSIRDLESDWERIFSRVEDAFALLAHYKLTAAMKSSSLGGSRVDAEEEEEGDEEEKVKGMLQGVVGQWTNLLQRSHQVSRDLASQHGALKTAVETGSAAFLIEDAQFLANWNTNGPSAIDTISDGDTSGGGGGGNHIEASERLRKFQIDLEGRIRKRTIYTAGYELFKLPPPEYHGLQCIEREVAMLTPVYDLYTEVAAAMKKYGSLSWPDVTIDDEQLPAMLTQVGDYYGRIKKLPKEVRELGVYKDSRAAVEGLQVVLTLIQGLTHEAIRPRHWTELAIICNCQLPSSLDALCLQHLFDANLSSQRDAVEDLCSCAIKEAGVEAKLAALAAQWSSEAFVFIDHKGRAGAVLRPTETAELKDRLEDTLMSLGTLTASRYSLPFRQELQSWAAKLGGVSEILEQWLTVQNLWMYLEAVFSGGDIVKQLPTEARRFASIDRGYMQVVKHANDIVNCVDTCVGTDLLKSLLPKLLEQLEVSQKSLAAYLEAKRVEFPRFYFVSDPTLLEILSLGSDPAAVVPHLQSGLFDSLSNVTFDKNDKHKITHMISREGEKVALDAPVEATGNVEVWLQRLVKGMQSTVKSSIRQAVEDMQTQSLEEFIFSHPAQVALLGLQFQWTTDQQAALHAAYRQEKGALTKVLKKAEATLSELVSLTLRSDLTPTQRTSLETCITVYMHQKEASEELLKKKVRDPLDFEWLKQVRMAWRPDRDTIVASICDVDFEYSYEYLGVKERLVITPLTDACYITLTQALGMYLGGAPAGPAGTGKTETTKDLGATLGKYVVVFNCSDQMDYKGMGKIYKGLAQSGLWGCFDEFNRINLDVLSVCAQQVHCILTAIREQKKSFTFTDGSIVPLDPKVGFFITMNPGYAGRQELPENLKALFRGVTMMVPNRQIIMKVKLAACGYQQNDILSKKFHVLYDLCEQQLSKQPHYDFGLRNILSVLRTAGSSKRMAPEKSEVFLMMRTLRDMNMSKLVAEDAPLFLSLIEDLFPGQRAERTRFDDISGALESAVRERGLQPEPSWLNKIIQLYETQLVRHGIMLVGPSGTGKSCAIECLAAALTQLGNKTVVWRMNPKSITAPQMFGQLDAATGDWTDGVFSALWRRAAKTKNQNTWIVLDGPVDAIWIENLNTVLDDNKVLTLANGDRVLMTPNMRLIFEAENLNNASPATVSRAGIIYMSHSELGWKPVVKSWLQSRPESQSAVLSKCFEKCLPPLLECVNVHCKPVIHTEVVCQVSSLLTLLSAVLQLLESGQNILASISHHYHHNHHHLESTDASERRRGSSRIEILGGHNHGNTNSTSSLSSHNNINNHYTEILEKIFIYCAAWSLGGVLTMEGRHRFDGLIKTLTQYSPKSKLAGDSVYEYVVNEVTGDWQHWQERIPTWTYPSSSPSSEKNGSTTTSSNSSVPDFSKIVVPTLDSVRFGYLLSLVHSINKSTLLVGAPGTAKTTTAQQFLQSFDPETHIPKTVTFSYLTTPGIFQSSVEGAVEKRQGRSFGPPGGRSMTLFIDDLSIPAFNKWGDQITNEAVRQLLEQGGLYTTEKPVGEFKQLVDTKFVAAMVAPGDGKNDIPNRLKRQFVVLYMPPPSAAAVQGIYGKIMGGKFGKIIFKQLQGGKGEGEDNNNNVAAGTMTMVQFTGKLVQLTLELWTTVQAKMVPTPDKFHYSFSLRDISRIFQGISLADLDPLISLLASQNQQQQQHSIARYILSLWGHECQRVFADKLVSLSEKGWVLEATKNLAQQHLSSLLPVSIIEDALLPHNMVFVDCLRDAPIDEITGEPSGPRPSTYESVTGGLSAAGGRIQQLVDLINSEIRSSGQKHTIVLFEDALEHLLRISRLMAMEKGHGLLVGVGGSGKQSLAKLAAAIAGARAFQISLSKSYGVSNLLDDIRTLFKDVALKGQNIAFILTDSDVRDDSFLEYINQLLMTGDIAGLFPKEELDALLNDVRPMMKKEWAGVPDTADNLHAFVLNRVRRKLHVLLCFSPVGDKLSRWAQQFPGIINGCTIDWFLPWPQAALTAVSSHLLKANLQLATNNDEGNDASSVVISSNKHRVGKDEEDKVKLFLQKFMAAVHTRVTAGCNEYSLLYKRTAHVTPKSYLSFISTFDELFSRKVSDNRSTVKSLVNGLEKMKHAKVDVNKMQVELGVKEQDLAVANKEAEVLLEEIGTSTAVAEKEKQKVAVIVDGVTKKASEIAETKAEAECDLAEAQPALDKAVSALNSIAPKDITALKSLKSPPDVIKRIFDCVLLLRHQSIKPIAWHDVKGNQVIVGSFEESVKMLGDMNFLQTLINFPKERINDETVELLQPYFNAPDFNFEAAKKASGNVAGLCNWARAMCDYHEVAKVVDPKIARLKEAEAELSAANEEQAAAEAELAKVQEKLDEMQQRFDAAMTHKRALEEDAASTRRKMANATALISALGGEEVRWQQQREQLDASLCRLVGDCALAASFTSYLGPFNKEFRAKLLRDFTFDCVSVGLPCTPDLAVTSILAEETEMGQWAVEGLPTDALSVQNGILVTKASRYPLLVDPQGQGRGWLIQREAAAGLQVTETTDRHFKNTLEACLSNGKPLLIENVDEHIDPALDPILEKKWVPRGSGFVLVIGDKEIDVSPDFRLYLTTRLPNPKFSPELSARVAIVDFTVTQAGLEDQLLGRLILKEKGELEEQRQKLMQDVQSYRKRIEELESDLLIRLSSSSGNLLDDTALIDILAVTKATSQEVSARLVHASETRKIITEACEEYRPVARRAALLYFLISQFSEVNCMYQTSLAQFMANYESSIHDSEKAATIVQRTVNIINHLTSNAFLYTQRGLFEKHKLPFALLLANKILVQSGDVLPKHVDCFLKMGGCLDITTAKKKPKDWIPSDVWLNVLALKESGMEVFQQLPEVLARAPEGPWKAWCDQEAPEASPHPPLSMTASTTDQTNTTTTTSSSTAPSQLTGFYKLCLVRAFREDRAMVAAAEYISKILGPQFAEPPSLDLEQIYQSMSSSSQSVTGASIPITDSSSNNNTSTTISSVTSSNTSNIRPKAANVPLTICLLSSGADITKKIEDLAHRHHINTLGVSMGQGQEVIARRHLATAAVEGHWVLLQNAHLGLNYLTEVEKWLASHISNNSNQQQQQGEKGAGKLHPGFHLWITTEPHPSFPIGLLHMGVKLTNEPPVGLRACLKASLQSVSQDLLESVNRKEWRPLVFATCFLHAVVQERRKFGPIGWNVPYEFNQSDLAASLQFLQNHLQDVEARKAASPDWSTIRYMIASIQYGGRITDEFDRTLMDTYAQKFYHPDIVTPGWELFRDGRTGAVCTIPSGSSMGEIDQIRGFIDNMPATEGPDLFGLHSNAERASRKLQVQGAIQLMVELQPSGGSSGNNVEGTASSAAAATSGTEDQQDLVSKTVGELLATLPPQFDPIETLDILQKLPGGAQQPLTIHLRQEIDRLNIVMSTVKSTLESLQLTIAGTIALNDSLASVLIALQTARPPASWMKLGWEAGTLSSWWLGLSQRHDQLYRWLNSGRPKSYWLTGFFNPQGFLTAVKQEVTRQHAHSNSGSFMQQQQQESCTISISGDIPSNTTTTPPPTPCASSTKWALDDVVMVSEVTKIPDVSAVREPPAEGVYIHGLYLDGVGWNLRHNKLCDAEAKRLYQPLPVMHVTAVLSNERKALGYFKVPCYKVAKRTGATYVSTFMLKSDEDRTKWILRGAALLCSVD